ncbi:MAG: hypothetical protein JSU00_22095 [Acidobacteria bacterium]|nr:hypothetical protein [Acidobacteriota bacterium]
MREDKTHLSDETLLLFADGEFRGRREQQAREHLAACWSCRLRMRELDEAIAVAARWRQASGPAELPAPEGARALLKARLREAAAGGSRRSAPFTVSRRLLACGVFTAVAGLLIALWVDSGLTERSAVPRFDLTPGAVRAVAATDVCAGNLGGNADVRPAVERQVFDEYGMPNAERRAFEVDYLITPALGGSDDIRNLWPQPYAGSPWNAYVKDALEERLRDMVCSGQLDLATAQREIAVNWVAAYQKYFHSRRPLPQHSKRRD